MPKPKIGEIFQERYKILAQLGIGGMGIVYKAEQTDAGRLVAIKALLREGLDSDTVARFLREFRLLSKLSHPNIVTVYGLALDDENLPYAISPGRLPRSSHANSSRQN